MGNWVHSVRSIRYCLPRVRLSIRSPLLPLSSLLASSSLSLSLSPSIPRARWSLPLLSTAEPSRRPNHVKRWDAGSRNSSRLSPAPYSRLFNYFYWPGHYSGRGKLGEGFIVVIREDTGWAPTFNEFVWFLVCGLRSIFCQGFVQGFLGIGEAWYVGNCNRGGYKISGIVCSDEDERDACPRRERGAHTGPTLVMLAAFIRIEARSCRMQNVEFPRFLPSSRASRPLERLSQRPADLWESVRVWL